MYSWALVSALISSLTSLSKQGDAPTKCEEWEVLLTTPRKDTFCKPELTIAAELHKLRKCVCKPGYVRNAWGHCVPVQDCAKCKKWPNADYNECEGTCPLTCGKPVPSFCTKMCGAACACPPGFVRGSSGKFECVSIAKCPPACQPNSTFQICKWGCEPSCFKPPPKESCVPSCHTGQCVCNEGFAEAHLPGGYICVPWDNCPEYQQFLPKLL
uniref:Putative scavenger receptor cysteine-rich protein n=1 Tax=Rhipicephalus microplus TaxID=6941 RepID=A0A6G5A4Z8_RHIMP